MWWSRTPWGTHIEVNSKSVFKWRQLDNHHALVSLTEQNAGKAEVSLKRELSSNKIHDASLQRLRQT